MTFWFPVSGFRFLVGFNEGIASPVRHYSLAKSLLKVTSGV